MIEVIKQFFIEDDYNYLLQNLTRLDENKYRLKISVAFFAKNEHYNTRGFLSKEEICNILNKWEGWTAYLLYCYKKVWVINWYSLCQEKTEEQMDFYNKMKWTKYMDLSINKTCFDYEIDVDIQKLRFFWEAVFNSWNYWIPTRCLNDIISMIGSLNIKYDELLGFLKITKDSIHYYTNTSLIVFSLWTNNLYLEKLFNFIEIIASEHPETSKKVETLRKLIDESGKTWPWIYISKWNLVINWKKMNLRWDQRKICEMIFREPWKHISKTDLMSDVYKSDEKDMQLDEQIKKINSNKIYPASELWWIRQESWYVFYDKNYERKK